MQYTNEEIHKLIRCNKIVTANSTKDLQPKYKYLRNDYKAESTTEPKQKFQIFIRVSQELPEDFSIGLNHINEEGKSICLVRCNGKHGSHRNHKPGAISFFDFHIHTATAEAIAADEKPEQYAEITSEYATWQDAVRHFCQLTHITNAADYYPFLTQPSLF